MSISHTDLLAELQAMDPYAFEHLVADVWEALGWETEVSSASGDRGVDITAVQNGVFRTKTLIQVKRYGPDTTVGSEAVQQYASLRNHEHDVDLVVIVTTSGFTSAAVDMADRLNVKLLGGSTFVTLIEDIPADERREILERNGIVTVDESDTDTDTGGDTEPRSYDRSQGEIGVAWVRYATFTWLLAIGLATIGTAVPPITVAASIVMLVAWPALPGAMLYDAYVEERHDAVLYALGIGAFIPVVAPLFGVAYLARVGAPIVRGRED